MFPKYLSKGLDIRRRERLLSFAIEEDGLSLAFEGERTARAGTVILALAVEQSLSLLGATPSTAPELDTARALLGMCHSQPCLTVLALYEVGGAAQIREARGADFVPQPCPGAGGFMPRTPRVVEAAERV